MARTRVYPLPLIQAQHRIGPIDSLPDSVLSDIFVLAHCDREDSLFSSPTRFSRAVASVSRRWRAIALSTPRLWDFVDVSRCMEHVMVHLARNKRLPIRVSLNLVERDNTKANTLNDALRVLAERDNWTRIRELRTGILRDLGSFDIKSRSAVTLVVESFNTAIDANSMSILESIDISVTDYNIPTDVHPYNEGLCLHLPHSPLLREISLEQVGLSLIQLTPTTPLPGLQSLSLTYVSIGLSDVLLPLLELAPSLVELSFRDCWFWYGPADPTSSRPDHSIVLAMLERLYLEGVNEGIVSLNIAFRILDMPNLRSLDFRATVDLELTGNSFLVDWNAISHCQALETLLIQGLDSTPMENFLPHIHKLEHLQEFKLFPNEVYNPDAFVEQLVRRLLETPCCPMLECLDICFPLNTEVAELIEDLREARELLKVYVEEASIYEDEDRAEDWSDYSEGSEAGYFTNRD